MNNEALDRMRARARTVRSRAQVRAWKYRQRTLASGVWFRLRRVLADAKAAYVISGDDARQLLAEGFQGLACGRELAPEKTIIVVDERRLEMIPSRRPIRVDLGPEFLNAGAIALVTFQSPRQQELAP